MSDSNLFNIIPRLDTHLYAHLANKEYGASIELQQGAPESYFGYQRAAQMHLIRNDYDKALSRAYKLVVEKVQDNTVLRCYIRKSIEKIQYNFVQAAVELAKKQLV
ncbi:hypothetical protein BJV82DRAFT_664339 [Fennellomyces sp. T-0311]|nr:hypothetical protein BJV82DRAFT_664339 [Fennellomyces sp. T-0311]